MTNKQLNSEMILKQLETLAQKFVCFVCKQQNRKPVTITNCGHHFCHGCIMNVIVEGKSNAVCPQCDNKINLKSLITNKCVNQLFIHFESLLKAISDEMKLTVQLPPIMKTPKIKEKKTPTAVIKQQVQPVEPKSRGRKPSRSKSPAESKERDEPITKEIEGEIKSASKIIRQEKKTPMNVSKQQVQPTDPKRRGRKPTRSKSPSESKERDDAKSKEIEGKIKSPSGIVQRMTSRRASAIKASNAFPAMLRSEESSPDSTQLDIPVLMKPTNTQTKVSTWLRDAATSCIPTQDRPIITTTPVTQSTLVSVSQSRKLPSPRITQVPDDYELSERIVKDPYEFIPSQPDSIVKRPKIKAKPVAQKKNLTYAKKADASVQKKAGMKIREEPEIEMLLFKSQSEQYIAEKEEKRLKELERPIYMDTEASTSKQRGRRGKSLPVQKQNAHKLVEDSEEDEPIFVLSGKPIRKYRGLKRKTLPLYESEDEEENKITKKINEAEKHSLVIEKKKVGTSESKLISQVESRGNKTRSLSIAIDSLSVSNSPQQHITVSVTPEESKYLKKAGVINKSKLTMPSPGFSRLKKMKSDFRSPGRNKVVPLDVSTTSIAQKDLNTESAMNLDASITEISSIKSTRKSVRFNAAPPQQAETSKLQESFNSSVSSLGAPDLERGKELVKAVERIEHEIENNIINDSDLETSIQDTQQSTTLIENSVPMETETVSLFKHIPKARTVEEISEPVVQLDEKEDQVNDVEKTLSPLKEVSNKIDSQKDTQMSQTVVNLLEMIHDVPKRKTFSLELNTGDIMTDIPSRESTQQQLISLTQTKSQQSVTSTPHAVPEESPVSRVRFMKHGKLYAHEPYQVPFYKLGYLSPKLQNKGLKFQPLHKCSCGGVSSAHVKTTKSSSTNTLQPNKIDQHSAEAQTTQSLWPEKMKPSKSTATNTSQPSQPSVEAQTTPSLIPQETREIQTSPQPIVNNSQSRITDSASDSNLGLNVARFISSQQDLGESIKKNIKSLKTSTQKFVSSQEPLFSSDSLPSSVSQDTCLNKVVIDLETPEEGQNPPVNNEEPMETEEDEEITVIEKTQEEHPKLFSKLSKIGVKNKAAKELELSNAFTINSDDILQATLSQPHKSILFALNKDDIMYESPSKLSKTSTPMSRNESDYNDEDAVQVRSASKLRKRGRPLRISSDSESEQEVKHSAKRPTRLSMRKSSARDAKPIMISSTDSDAPIRALVRADLAYAKAVAAEQASSAEESVATITLDSTPATTPRIEVKSQKSEEKGKTTKLVVTSPENRKNKSTTTSKVLESSHAQSLLEENTAASELNNPFFDMSVLHESIEDPNTEVDDKVAEPAKQFSSPASVLKTPEKDNTPMSRKLPTTVPTTPPVVEKQQYEDSDSDSDTIFESTPKRSASVKEAYATPPVSPPLTSVVTPTVTPKVVTPPRQLSIVWSSLNPDSVKLVEKFLQRFKQVKHSTAFLPITTHVVVPYEENKCSFSTLKYLLAVASGGWVVSLNWIKDCLVADKIVPEEPYEIGPRTSRISSEKLFQDFEIHCANGAYEHVPQNSLKQIIKYAGGKVIDWDQLKTPCTRKYRLVVAPTEDIAPELQNCEYPIILLDWVVESVEQYQLSAVASHLVRTEDDLIVSKMKLPKEMLEIPEDESTSCTSTNFTSNTITQP